MVNERSGARKPQGASSSTRPAEEGGSRHQDEELDIALDESFPASDAPSETQPGTSEPAKSSGFDEDREREIQERRARSRQK